MFAENNLQLSYLWEKDLHNADDINKLRKYISGFVLLNVTHSVIILRYPQYW